MKMNHINSLTLDDRTRRSGYQLTDLGSRRGVLVVEMIVCAILLATVSLVLVPALHGVARQQAIIRLESLTRIELNNQHQLLLEQEPRRELPADLKPSVWFHERYPNASMECAAVENRTASGLFPRAVRLTVRHHADERYPMFVRSVVIWLPDRGAQQ